MTADEKEPDRLMVIFGTPNGVGIDVNKSKGSFTAYELLALSKQLEKMALELRLTFKDNGQQKKKEVVDLSKAKPVKEPEKDDNPNSA